MKRLIQLSAWLVLLVAPAFAQAPPASPTSPAPAASAQKVLRLAFKVAETGFDPAQINDLYSRTVTPHIFEALYEYDHLARPVKIKPLTAAGMPEHSADFRTWTVKIRPGIFFADDPAFKGKKRELVAQDYVYGLKRFADPAVKSPVWTTVEAVNYLGLSDLFKQALASKKPFDYDREIEGVRALDRYTIQFKIAEPRPRFAENNLAASDLFGAVAREVVEFYGDKLAAHPVGTGPFKLVQWRRSSLIVLERNPEFREMLYDAEPAPDDAEGQALLKRFKGRKLPMVDRVEVSIIEESQPRWLSFLNAQSDLIEEVPADFINVAMPHGQVAPNLAKRGINGRRVLRSDIQMTLFNMDNALVGGYTPEKVALRRAIGLGVDVDSEIRLARRGMAIPAQGPTMPHTTGYDAAFKSEMSEFNPARAKALLDMFGYVDQDRDGWRDLPDGAPLLLEMNTQPDQRSRQLDELWEKNMKALGIRIKFVPAKWPENLKAARAGKYMMWRVGSSAAAADGQGSLMRMYGPMVGGQNMARFKSAEFDALYDRMAVMPDGPQREALFDQARRLAAVWMPMKYHVHQLYADMWHPWLAGYRRPLFWQEWWHRVDVDPTQRRP